MNGDPRLYQIFGQLNIPFDYYEHPAAPTIEIAMQYWRNMEATHCKNLFFRNHKGDKHYLVILECSRVLDIHDLEKRLHQGKISFASEQRMQKYLGLKPGSVSPFGLINDQEHHVHVFFDARLESAKKISFHPNINTASIILAFEDFLKFMKLTGNSYEFINLYDSSY
jgi:Ala-tRNA(Pro) deacylase